MSASTVQRFAPPALFLLSTVLASGCIDESVPRPSALTVESVNAGQTLTSDVYNNGPDALPGTDDDFILEDRVPVVVRNRPGDPLLGVRGTTAAGAVVIRRYEVRFSGAEGLSPIFGSIEIRVAPGGTGEGEIVVVPAGYKLQPPMVDLISSGEIRAEAQITLIGEEETSGEEISASATLPVRCADWPDR